MPNKITYTIKTADGKEHQVSKENIDKHGIQAYADAYEGATIRMRDSKKGDYDIPLANYNDAKAQGLHAFSWEHLPPKAQPQAKQQVAQKQPTQQVATTAPGTPMTTTQKAQVLNNVSGIVAQSQSDLSRTIRKFDYAKQNTGLDVKPIKLGENRKIATEKNKNGQTTYLDAEGNRFDDHAQANFSQTQIEEDEAKRKDLLGYIDKKGMSSVNSAYDKQYSELEDFKKKHPYLSAFSRALSAFSGRMSGGGTANINQYRPEEARAGLAALALNQKTRQAIDEGKRYEQGDTGFWGRATRGLKKGLTSASTYDLGLSDTDIAGSLKGAADRYAKGQATQMDELLLDAAALNSETEGKYADALGGWFGAGEGIPGVASFMMQIGSNPMSGFGKATAQSVAKTVTKRVVQKFGTGLAAKAAITLAKGATRVAADAVEAGVVTAMYSPTKIVGDYLNRKTGTVVHDGNGGYTFEGKEYSDIKAVAKAINDQNAENLSEMWGDYLPGIGKVGKLIGKGARKIGLGKVVNAFEQMSSSQWMKTWNEFMDRTKWNGLSGEYMEEAEKNLYNALTNGDMTLDTNPNTGVFSRKINEDTFKSVALMSGIMSGISTVGYTRFKYKASRGQKKADNNAKAVLGAEKWSEIKKLIDNADDKSIGGIIEQIGNDNSLNTKQKMAILDYQYKSAVAHGANIQDLKNKLEGNYDEKANRYDAGYNATEEELANIKNELELRQRQLAETFKDDPSALQQIEEDPKAFLQGLKESEVGGEKAKVINAYEETRAAYDGMIQRVKDNIDDAVTENNTVIEQRTHQDGNIYSATMKLDDRKVYVVGGNVQMNEDGKGIDHEKSSSSVMVRDAETGKIEMVDPSAILSVDTPVNAEEEKATSSEQIRQTYAQEQANKIDGVLEFKAGDTYSIIGEDKKQHTIQIIGEAIDEKTKQPNPDMVMASIDGLEPTMLPKEQIQAMNDEENLWRLDQSLKQDEDVENETPLPKQSYHLNDEITLINEDGKPVRGSITTDQNEDGKFEVYTEEPINGKRVNLFTAEELDAMSGKQQEEQTNQEPVQGEQMGSPTLVAENTTTQKEDVSGVNDGTIAENATVQKEETPQRQSTALERIPTNEQGEPIYEQADPETAWDAIVEQTEGDESIAQSVADGMVADMEAAVKRAEKAKVKGGTTIAEKIAAEKERVATIEQAKATLEHWKKIASTNSRRQEAIQAEENRKAKEAALLRKEQEEKERAMREEEERVKREALNGVPDIVEDKAIDARARGYRRISGDKVDRQEPLNAIKGKEVQVKFDDKNIPTGHVSLIDVDELQPSHKNGHRNPLHFIDEAQPKERKDDASIDAARKIAANIRPEEITSSVTAYTGAPTVNSRGEVIQGNNRSAALKEMWAMHKEQGEKYKQYIIDHAEELGLNPADVRSMKHPVLVNMLDVNDNDAISLGQFVASDTESGGTERIKPKNVVKKLGNRMKTFANILLRTTDEDMSFAELIDRNGVEALKWMSANGSITSTQYKSAFDSKGNLTAEAKNDLKGVMYQSIFEGGSTQLEEMFNALPIKAQKAILATAYRDYDSPTIERMVEEIQNSIMAYYALSLDEQFKAATNHKSARWAVESWKRQYAIDDSTGESYLPSEKYSNFALLLATMYKGDSQSFIQGTFKQMYDLIQGTQEDNLFEQPDNTPRTLVEAIKETLNIEYDGQQRSDILASNSTASQQGEQRSNGNSKTGGRSETRNGSEDYQGGTQGDSGRSRSERSSGGSQEEVTERNSHLTEAEKTSENEAKELATNAVVEALVRVGVPVEVVSDEAVKGVLPLGAEKHVVYHGSGAKFGHFDHSHMGEGEGAQAYGWGSYVTEVEGIGKKYAQAMLKEKYKENRTINEMARDRLISDGSKDESLKYLNDLLKEEWVDKKRVKAQIKIIETGKFLPEGKVSLYTVDIPDNTGKNYLDWESDIPVKEKNRIRIALTKSIIDKMGSATSSERQDVRNSISTEFRLDVRNFKGIYKLMSSYTSPQEASELLRNLGYTGISYPAQYLSGGRSDGARNYVIFDEKDLKITNRVEFMKSPDGVVYGWTIGGRIYLTKAGLNPETPIHEYTHIWANAMKVHNMKGWKSIKDLLVDTPIWDEVLNDENYSEIRNDEDSVASEVLSRISGKENAKRMEEEAQKVIADSKDLIEKAETLSVLNRVRKALKTFWSWVGKELFDIEKFNSINEVTDRVLYDLVNGTALQVQNETTRVETNPTEAQKEAGNYKKGHIKVDGMNITIEQPKGSIRRGKDASGKEWESEMHNTYGYIRGTEGVDGDHIDIFLSDNPNEGNVFVVDQVNKDGSFDEHKVMYGFADKESARQAYLSNYEDGWQGLGNITEVSKEEFKKWIGSSKRKTKPFAEYKGIIKSNKSVSSPVAMSEDEYLTSKGLNGNMTDYMLDKLRIPHSETARQQKQREKEAARVRADFDNQKEEARKEYRQKIAKGELREPTKQEAKEREIAKLIKTANGHEDNPSVQAARRLLAKRGVDWRTDKGDTSDNDWIKSKEDVKSNVVHSFGNSASQNNTSIKLSDTSFASEEEAEKAIQKYVEIREKRDSTLEKITELIERIREEYKGDPDVENIVKEKTQVLRDEFFSLFTELDKFLTSLDKSSNDYVTQLGDDRLVEKGVLPINFSSLFQSRKNEVAQNAVVHLLKRIGIPVHFISRVGAKLSGNGTAKGWTNGLEIWITKDRIDAETPVHEYTHIWTFALMKKNPKLWAEIKNLLKDSEWIDKIQSMDEYKDTLDNEDLLYSEVLSRISGERNGEKFESMAFKLIEEVNSVEKKVDLRRGLEKLRDGLKRFWEWVGVNLFGMKEFKSVDDVCDRILFDLLNESDIARTEEMREYYEEEREMNTIIDKAKEDGTYLKAPNGENSKLPEKEWAYARTKEFKSQLSDRLNLILNESKEDFKDWEKEEFRDLFKAHGLLGENNEPSYLLVSDSVYTNEYFDRLKMMQEEAQETMNSGKGGKSVSSVKSVDLRDAEYIKAVENNDTETIQRLLSEEAERKGYSNDSSYQGSLAFNGAAPSQNAYFETKEERKEAWENDDYEDTMSLGDYVDSGIDTNNLEWNLTDPMALRQADPERREAIENLRQTVRSNSKTITIYRAVDANIKENEIRNGDWVTPSRSYAEYHIGLQNWENGRVIEQEVSIDDLWWDGNDIAEWGYDNGKGEVYKNTPNNRKMFEVTYDDKGNIIPLSERFNEDNDDIRYRYEELEEVNQRFNEELDNLTEANADKVILLLGKPSDILLSSGIENKPMKLYGNKIIKKMKKHGFALDELRDLPKAVADPIAVFDNYQRDGNRSILTELRTQQGNFLVSVNIGKDADVDFNIVRSVFGKGDERVVDWINNGLATYMNKEKTLSFLSHQSAPIAATAANAGQGSQSYISTSALNADATYKNELSSAANIVKSFENPINNSEKKLDRKSTQGKEVTEKERQQMADRANELAKTLHLDNVEIVTDASTLEGKKAKAKGFYSTSTGKITIVIPNHSNIADVEKTLLHESVAHYGLRKLFGEHFDNFLDNVFKNASEDVRREMVKLAAKNKWDFRIATEEYLASLAEDTNFEKMPNGLWDKVKRLFLEMLRSIGLLKQKDGELNDNELRYILWRSYKNLKEKGQSNSILNKAEDIAMQHRLKVGNYSESTDKEVRFRDGEPQSKERVSAAERYEHRVSRSMFQSQEALQDSMLGLKEAMDAIIKSEGKKMEIENIEGFENAYLGENRLSSVNQAETEAFAHLVFKPMLDEVAKLAKNDKERSELTDYMMAKHGLERNEVMRKNALEEIVNNEKLSDAQKDARASIAEHRDYAGLTALTDANSVEEAESEAQRMVEEYEQKHDTTNLWDKVNTVTKGILSKSYECGMMNKQTYEKVRDMYQFYIPLRGFDEETSREAYAYLSHGQSAFNAPIKTAKGRSSKADDPFANMQSMAESAIMQGNRNVLVKQKFLNFALNHPSDLVSVNALWLKYDDVKEEWRPVFPDNIEETDTADEVEKKIQDFEQRMADLAKQDPERYKHGKDTENIPYRIVESRDLRQHQVVVKRNGRDYVLTINGNPRAAQALNGLTNPDNDVSGAIGAILNFGEKINRQLSAFYTTRNPDFVISNFIRDMLYANSIVWVKERPNYALRFHRNIGRCNPAQMKILLSKHKKGELDMNNSLEHMFHLFIMNGGETGYANVRDIEQHKNDIQRELKRANGKIGIKRSLSLLGEKLDEYNRAVENCARFAAFLTSREMGRTIDRSIYDAKDISVNFNKKGSGAKFMKATGQTKIGKTSAFISGIGRSGYVFWNAAIQGTTNFGRQFKRHPAKAFTASATMFILGALIAGMGMGDDGDDDKNSYWNLPESVRRSNILFRVGEQWVSIPLPVEYRSIYGMGELMISAMSGKEHFTDAELGKAIAGQVTQILPIDFLEGEGGVKAFVPSAVKPFAEVISNKGWTGMPIYKDTPYNKNMPEWTKTYKSANKYLVGLAKTLNEVTGGDAYTKGSVNINPAQIEYLLNGYFGGVSNTIDKLTKSAETIAGKRDYDPKSFLLLNRVLKSGDERTEEHAINREYYRLKEEYEILRDRLKNYENDTDNGVFDFSEKINFLYNSPEYARYEIFEDYREDIESLYKELKDAMSDEERAALEVELTGLKKQMIEEMNTTRK
ncbi:LPD38 domain-containing protein [Hoylesella nanceiensis]|uniref:LPD38 domain-containing protein n=1 Tax=Hoylesella nanceiensis TaxID=425941 RepID=UPI0028E3702D|nr:LPD38 domain-containing protein [Hoylesella nanceiensis]